MEQPNFKRIKHNGKVCELCGIFKPGYSFAGNSRQPDNKTRFCHQCIKIRRTIREGKWQIREHKIACPLLAAFTGTKLDTPRKPLMYKDAIR